MATDPTTSPEAPPAAPQATALLTIEAVNQRHPIHEAWRHIWQYYREMYQGGVLWASRQNPLQQQPTNPLSVASESGADFMPPGTPAQPGGIAGGGTLYLWRYPLERPAKFQHRLSRAFYVNILAPVVDFYAAVISKTDNITWDSGGEAFDKFWSDADLQKQSYLQFMTQCRTNAEAVGHTFIVCDSTRATGALITQRDVAEQGIRPYLTEVWPENMINWRLDKTGCPLEILYKVEGEVEGGIATVGPQAPGVRYYYWTRDSWQVYSVKDNFSGGKELVLEDTGTHGLGCVPVAVLYHKRAQAFLGEPLIKDSAKIGHVLSNWASALDESFEAQMFAFPVLYSKKSPTDVGVGVSVVLHLNPEDDEKFEYVVPETGPFEESWVAFYRLVELANKHMGIAPTAVGSGKVDAKSGVSKAWDFFESEKILSRMAGNEQDVADEIFTLAGKWMGTEFTGSLSYKTKFDLTTAQDDINDLISLQSAGMPLTARKEMMRQVITKKLPNLPEALVHAINKEIDAIEPSPDPLAAPPAPGGGAAPGALPVTAKAPADKPGKVQVAPGKTAVAA